MTTQTDKKQKRTGTLMSAGLWFFGVGLGFALLIGANGGHWQIGVVAAVFGILLAAIGWGWRLTLLLESRQPQP